jgi:hypothetical protein
VNIACVSGRSVVFAVVRALGLHHQTVQRCIERAVVEGPMAALEIARARQRAFDYPRSQSLGGIVGVPEGEEPAIRTNCGRCGFWPATPASVDQRRDMRASPTWHRVRCARSWTRNKILDQEEVKPHKVRYYLEQRDHDFAEKMADMMCVYRQVKILKRAAAAIEEAKRGGDHLLRRETRHSGH